ncbi:MAG: hypothetical protein NMNS02_12480 [Nitrosomonas sp.]|nr:MAG: hypothetical protein NMNS02_12480 [Nitrosomonas sp.]
MTWVTWGNRKKEASKAFPFPNGGRLGTAGFNHSKQVETLTPEADINYRKPVHGKAKMINPTE